MTKTSSHRLNHIARELRNRSGTDSSVDQALISAGLTRSDLDRANYKIDNHKEARFLQAAVEIVADTSFAAAAGIHFIKNSAITSYVAKYSENLRGAIENARKYSVLVEESSDYILQTSSNSISFTIICNDPYLRNDRRHREFMTFTILAIMRTVTDRDFHPLEIRFTHSAPDTQDAIQRLAGCPIVFNAEETEIILAPTTLELPVPTYDPSLLHYLQGYGDNLLSEINQPAPNLQALVENFLVSNLPGRMLSVGEVASGLGMGRRTLARKLAAQGLSYSTIADELRCSLSTRYLIQSETPIAEIAFLLGFSDQASFTSAFKRWTGETPKVFRMRHLSSHA